VKFFKRNKGLSTGEMLDRITYGSYAISTKGQSKDTIISVDDENWLFVVYPHREFKTYDHNFKRSDNDKEEKIVWEIRTIDLETATLFDTLPERKRYTQEEYVEMLQDAMELMESLVKDITSKNVE
jgi:hypothetical protein